MKVTFDENGYVNGWCMVGDNGGKEYDPPEDFDAFLDNCFSFKVSDGKLVRDTEKEEADRLWDQGTLNGEAIERILDEHWRTPYPEAR